MGEAEFSEYEEMSRRVLMAAYRNPSVARHGLRLADVLMNLPERDIAVAKKVHSYVERVNEMEFRTGPPDPETEKLLRTALALPDDKRSAVGIMENLGVGIYTARKLMAMIQKFHGAGYKAAPVRVKELHAEEDKVELEPRAQKDLVERATERAAKAESRPPPKRPSPYEAPELYVRSQREKKEAEPKEEGVSEVKGRRCLFHGGLAVMKCPSCDSVLCQECTSSGACPRCKAALGTGPVKKSRDDAEGSSEKGDRSEGKGPEQPRDWSRL
jgi:hypothetical protein